jgi:hypothetical protein
MLKYTVDIKGNINTFINVFTKGITDIFNNISVTVDTNNQTCVTLTNNISNEIVCYFYVDLTLYNERTTLIIKTYGLNIFPTDYQKEDTSDWGPQIVYKNSDNVLCSRAGFINVANQKFIVDSITLCLDDNNVSQYFLAFGCKENSEPSFLISPTNLGNIGFIGVTTNNDTIVGIRTLTYNNSTTVEHNVKAIQVSNSTVTALAKMFIPESLNGEYFEYIYIVTALEDINDVTLQYDNHIYLLCLYNHIAALIY